MLRPLGSRILVKPDIAPDQTASGLLIPDSSRKDPEMSGTVVAVGRGPDSATKIRTATIARCMRILDEVANRVPLSALHLQLMDAFAAYQIEQVDASGLKEGDTVCFPYTAGQKLNVDGESYITLREDDCVAVWTPTAEKEEAA
jgi:co-chaperonin GroES (HSP10)